MIVNITTKQSHDIRMHVHINNIAVFVVCGRVNGPARSPWVSNMTIVVRTGPGHNFASRAS